MTREPLDQMAERLAADMTATDLLIREHMASEFAPRIPEITEHLIGAGGKRVRPLLVLAAAEICGYRGDHHHKLAATVEFIHTATLLHDDVVDESAKRRGKATANLLWDNKSSILVGDYLFARAFRLMVATGSLTVLDILSSASAVIAEGEVLQLSATGDLSTNEARYLQIIRGKTAALFAAAAESGALIAGAEKEIVEAFCSYGDALGIAFQIADDVLDYSGETGRIGKQIGDDFRERKMSLPLIYAINASSADERIFWERTIGRGHQESDDLEQALSLMHRHGSLEQARDEAFNWAARAREFLALVPEHPLKNILEDLSYYVVQRLK